MSAHSTAIEHSGGLSLLQAVHAAFPLASLEPLRSGSYGDVLLSHGKTSNIRINRIYKTGRPLNINFKGAQQAFAAVVAKGKSLPALAGNSINFSGKYSGTNFEEIEIDCLIKISAAADSIWTCDPTASSELYHIRRSGREPLARTAAPSAPLASLASAAAAASMPPSSASNDKLSTTSAIHYPAGATHYVIGEAYGRLDLDAADASTPVQKLLQLERILCLLLEKERTSIDNIKNCILGVVLIGPSIDDATCAAVFAALHHYRAALRRLWALSEAGRLLSIRLQPLATQLQRGVQQAVTALVAVTTELTAELRALNLARQKQ